MVSADTAQLQGGAMERFDFLFFNPSIVPMCKCIYTSVSLCMCVLAGCARDVPSVDRDTGRGSDEIPSGPASL